MKHKFEKVGIVSTQSVHKNTGKHWDQWVAILDKAGARNWVHKEIVALLKKKYKLSMWWQQGVATGYEQAIGVKTPGKNTSGYTMTATKTMPISHKKLWKFLQSEQGMKCWLNPLSEFQIKPKETYETRGGIFGEIRTMKPGVRVRMTWTEPEWLKPSIVCLYLIPRKGEKSMLVFQHDAIPDLKTKTQMRDHWKLVLTDLAELAKSFN